MQCHVGLKLSMFSCSWSDFSTVAALALVAYEFLANLENEVRYVWRCVPEEHLSRP